MAAAGKWPASSTGWYANLAGDEQEERDVIACQMQPREIGGERYFRSSRQAKKSWANDLEIGLQTSMVKKNKRSSLWMEYGGFLLLSVCIAFTLFGSVAMLSSYHLKTSSSESFSLPISAVSDSVVNKLIEDSGLANVNSFIALPIKRQMKLNKKDELMAVASKPQNAVEGVAMLPEEDEPKAAAEVVGKASGDVEKDTKEAIEKDVKQEAKEEVKQDNEKDAKDQVMDVKEDSKDNSKENPKRESKEDAKQDTEEEVKQDSKADAKQDTKEEVKQDNEKDAKDQVMDVKEEDMKDLHKSAYTVELAIGSNNKRFTVAVDTLSSELWVPGPNCKRCQGHSVYSHEQSETYSKEGTTFEVNDRNSHVEGVYAVDVVSLGGLAVSNFTFAEATSADGVEGFDENLFDGVLGVGLAGSGKRNTLIERMHQENLLKAPVFGMKFGRSGEDGVFTLGGYSNDYYSGEMAWLPITDDGSSAAWEVKLDGLQVAIRTKTVDVIVPLKTDATVVAFDSRSFYLAAATHVIHKVAEEIGATEVSIGDSPSEKRYYVKCNETESMPNVEFSFGGNVRITMEPNDYVIKSSKQETDSQNEGNCLVAFVPHEKNDSSWILGQVFLQKYFTVFDIGQKKIGFAPALH